jgi:hypothetical protein
MSRASRGTVAVTLALLLAACDLLSVTSPTPTPATEPTPTPPAVASASPAAPSTATPTAAATSTPATEPELALDLPDGRDDRVVSVTITPNVGDDGGEIIVSVTSAADTRVDDLVVRWPEALGEVLFLAPFVPSEDRIRDGGDPLVQPWTKWVVGPGEHGEPAGTVSLGYGPLFPGATLDVRIFVERVAPGPVAFDLHVLAGNDLLTLGDGQPARFRVELP